MHKLRTQVYVSSIRSGSIPEILTARIYQGSDSKSRKISQVLNTTQGGDEGIVIRIKIRELAEEKGIKNPFQLMKVTGLNYAQCHFYWNSEAKQIGIDALNRICMALGVTPGQIFEFETDPDWSSDRPKSRSKSGKPSNK